MKEIKLKFFFHYTCFYGQMAMYLVLPHTHIQVCLFLGKIVAHLKAGKRKYVTSTTYILDSGCFLVILGNINF